MKLIIQIPCFNEEASLPVTLAELPRTLAGFESVEWLVVDDGSTDATASVAADLGVDYIIHHAANRGLAAAFMTGIKESLARGADVIVNTDADNQYCAADISLLTESVLSGKSGFVVGIRPVYESETMPFHIRLLHWIGSMVVMFASRTDITDPPSGFRAFSRSVAGNLQVANRYTYTLETIIQAGNSGISVLGVPIRINPVKLRPSRLMSSPYSYVVKSIFVILSATRVYNPFRFMLLSALPILFIILFLLLNLWR